MTVRKKTSEKKISKKSKNLGRNKSELKDFKLGETHTEYATVYDPKLLEAFDNKNPENDAWVSFVYRVYQPVPRQIFFFCPYIH